MQQMHVRPTLWRFQMKEVLGAVESGILDYYETTLMDSKLSSVVFLNKKHIASKYKQEKNIATLIWTFNRYFEYLQI